MSGPRSRKERVAAVVAATLDQSAGGFQNALRDLRNDWRYFPSTGNRRVAYTVTVLVPERSSGYGVPEDAVGKYGVSISEAGVNVYFRAFTTRRAAKAKATDLWRKAKERFDASLGRQQAAALRKLEAPKQRAAKRRATASDPQHRLQHAQAMLRRADTRVTRAATLQKRWKRAVAAAQKAVDRSTRGGGV